MNPIGFTTDETRFTASVSAETKKGLIKALYKCAEKLERTEKQEKKRVQAYS